MACRTNCSWRSWALRPCLLCSLELCWDRTRHSTHSWETTSVGKASGLTELQSSFEVCWNRWCLSCLVRRFDTVLKGVDGLLLDEIVDKAAFEEECFFFFCCDLICTLSRYRRKDSGKTQSNPWWTCARDTALIASHMYIQMLTIFGQPDRFVYRWSDNDIGLFTTWEQFWQKKLPKQPWGKKMVSNHVWMEAAFTYKKQKKQTNPEWCYQIILTTTILRTGKRNCCLKRSVCNYHPVNDLKSAKKSKNCLSALFFFIPRSLSLTWYIHINKYSVAFT